jgi:hypothetical protein
MNEIWVVEFPNAMPKTVSVSVGVAVIVLFLARKNLNFSEDFFSGKSITVIYLFKAVPLMESLGLRLT